MKPEHLLILLQLNDSAFPTGAFTHSSGLETYTQCGLVQDYASLMDLVTTRLRYELAGCDLIMVHAAMQAYQQYDLAGLIKLDQQLTSMKTAREIREASSKVGRGLLKTVLALADDAIWSDFQQQVQQRIYQGHQALVYGMICAGLGIEPAAALLTYTHQFVTGQAFAAVKLLALGQTQAQTLIRDLQPLIAEVVEVALTRTLDDCQTFSPALDVRAMQHEYLFRRMFIS